MPARDLFLQLKGKDLSLLQGFSGKAFGNKAKAQVITDHGKDLVRGGGLHRRLQLGMLLEQALRLYQGLQGSVNTGAGEDLAAYDLRRAVEENPDTRMIVFADTDAVLRTGDSLADAMEQLLRENAEPAQETGEPQTAESAAAETERPLVCSIAVAYGEWGYDGTYTPEEGDTRWNADTMEARLGEYATPGKDLLLALDGKDSPLTEGEALLQGSDTAPAGTVQKLLVLSTDNKVRRSTPESGTEAE